MSQFHDCVVAHCMTMCLQTNRRLLFLEIMVQSKDMGQLWTGKVASTPKLIVINLVQMVKYMQMLSLREPRYQHLDVGEIKSMTPCGPATRLA